jgi:hypothetical protein
MELGKSRQGQTFSFGMPPRLMEFKTRIDQMSFCVDASARPGTRRRIPLG